jgi:high-affinity iron transporter
MLPTAVIVFREVLEAALIIGIVLAATRGVAGRGAWVAGGIAGGAAAAIVIAIFAEAIASAASGMGQEIFNAVVLFAAVSMLGWHNIWMKRHGSEMSVSMKSVGEAVRGGAKPMHVLAVVVGLAVLREGAEVVLFLHGVAASGANSAGSIAAGGAAGLALGMGMGGLLYFGLLRIPSRYVFSVTGWLILLLAAGMAAQGAAFLAQADLLPTLGETLWDSSWFVADGSLAGKFLHALVGYTARPSGIQLVFYAATIAAIVVLMRMVNRPFGSRRGTQISAS